MALFEFELIPVEDVIPWGEGEQRTLSWFALTDGTFSMPVGGDRLFEYTPEILAHWNARPSALADYQVAGFARDMLSAVAAALAPLPASIERHAADWNLLASLRRSLRGRNDDNAYAALRWLGERSPWTGYLVASPDISFVRVGDEIRVHWDNEDRQVDGIRVWTATRGVFALSIEAFVDECRSFRDRLRQAMTARIDRIESGRAKPQVDVDVASLRQQHDTWQRELEEYTDGPYRPDIAWDDAEMAIRKLFPGLALRDAPT